MPRHLVSYFGNRYLDHFARDLEEIVDHGFNGIVHCVTEADLEWGLERVGEIFKATRAAGLECWADPWGLGRVFGGEAHSGFAARNPDALQRLSTGETLPHACLSRPAFRKFVAEWIDGVASSGTETIFWDEPHMAFTGQDAWACACDVCFPERLGSEETQHRRVEITKNFLDEITRHAAEKGVRNSVCLYPFEDERLVTLGLPDLSTVAGLEHVDDVGVDPYPAFQMARPLEDFDADRFVGKWADRLVKTASEQGVSVHIWIQGFALPEGFEHLVVDCAEAARNHGVRDLAMWAYRAAEVTSMIRPANPEKVWTLAKTVFQSR